MRSYLTLLGLLLCLVCDPLLGQTPEPVQPGPSPTVVQDLPTDTPSPVVTASPDLKDTTVHPSLSPMTPIGFPLSDGTRAHIRGPLSGAYLLTVSGAEGYNAQHRANLVFERLQTAARIQGSQASLVTSQIYDGVVVLLAQDTVLATVMPEDLDMLNPRALSPDELRALELGVAERWRRALQKELQYAAWIQRPQYLKVALPLAGLAFLTTFGIFIGLDRARKRYPLLPIRVLKALVGTFTLIFFLWLFPNTKHLAWTLESTVLWPLLRLLLLVTSASLCSFLIERLIRRHFENLISEPGVRPRRAQRLQTLCIVLNNTVRVIVYLITIGIALSLLPFNFLPLLTSAGVIGVALGLATQDYLKDIFAGITILLEDRFGVGDWIEWGTYSGLVESVSLRATRLRTIEGGLVSVPNADLRVVNNLSNEWAQVDFRIRVAYNTDIPRALEVLKEEADKLASDWNDRILEPPSVKGVNELGTSAVILRLYFKTVPLQQWDVQREFNLRMKLRFDQEGIEIPFPQSTVWVLRKENMQPDQAEE